MGRVVGEILVLLVAIVISIAILGPAISAASAGVAVTPYDEALLVLGMVYGLLAPIGYFLSGEWWWRAAALLGAAVTAVMVALAAYMFESHRPFEGVVCLVALAVMIAVVERTNAYLQKRRQEQLDALEAIVMMEIARAAREYGGMDDFSPTFQPVVSMVRQMAQSEAWAAIHQAKNIPDARGRVDDALAMLQQDLRENTVIEAPSVAAKIVGVIRTRLLSIRGRADLVPPAVQV